MIEVKNVCKSFGETEVLKDVSATFLRGKTNLIIGASGSGKTTLTQCIVGLHDVTSGEVLYDGVNFSGMNKPERKDIRTQIGFLFQGGALFDSMTVEENVMFPLRMFTKQTAGEMKQRVDFCLDRVNLPQAHGLFPAELSGGMKKRVAIARAIAMNPRYLFCDEPNSGLDPQTSIVIDQLIQEITGEYDMTTIVITHDMNSVLEIGEKIIFIHQGSKWWEGDKEDILETDNKELTDFVYASDFMKKIKSRARYGK